MLQLRSFEYLPDSAPEEKNLAAYVEVNGPKVEAHRKERQYGDALMLLATARERVDAFFDKVMVMVEDQRVRANRLALLRDLLKEFSTIADFSEIVTEEVAGNGCLTQIPRAETSARNLRLVCPAEGLTAMVKPAAKQRNRIQKHKGLIYGDDDSPRS